MKAIAILNLKGGVGKTVTAVNVAHILASEHAKRVLLIDCDSQCNSTEFYGVDDDDGATLAEIMTGDADPFYPNNIISADYGVDLIPASDRLMDLDLSTVGKRVNGKRLRDLCDAIREDNSYDYVLFDCPPAFNAASAAALLAADSVIVPIKLDAFSVRGLANVRHQITNMRKVNPGLRMDGALITMWHNASVIVEAEASLRKSGVLTVFKTVIRRTDKIDEMTFERKPITLYSPYSAAGRDYRRFVSELLKLEVPTNGI